MKKINKILSVALVAVMVCATLVGCGNNNYSNNNSTYEEEYYESK